MDIYPTVLSVTGVQPPSDHILDGTNLKTQIEGKQDTGRKEQFLMHFPHKHRSSYFTSFRDGDWKIIYHYRPNDNPAKTQYELFNLVTDPYENENLAERKPKVLKRMMESLVTSLKANPRSIQLMGMVTKYTQKHLKEFAVIFGGQEGRHPRGHYRQRLRCQSSR